MGIVGPLVTLLGLSVLRGRIGDMSSLEFPGLRV